MGVAIKVGTATLESRQRERVHRQTSWWMRLRGHELTPLAMGIQICCSGWRRGKQRGACG